jgi:hypothetical protein
MSALALAPVAPRLAPARADEQSTDPSPEFVHHGVPVVALPPGLQPLLVHLRHAPWIWAALAAEAKALERDGATGELVLRIPWQYGHPTEPRVDLARRHSRPRKGRQR